MPKKLPVSVYFISGAEAHRIDRALASVSGWAGEIIMVLNSEVQDGTEEIALKHGAKVFREPWKGFISQKNSAVGKTSLPWLLNLDADEVVTPELAREIGEIVSMASAPHKLYEFPRCTLFCGKWIRHGDWYPDHVRRLSRKDCTNWGGEEPHASIQIQEKPGRLKSDLLHYTAETINHQVIKSTRYADIFALNYQKKNKSVSNADLFFRPAWRFLRAYVFKLGFIDGWQGLAIAWMTAFYTFLRYVRVREDGCALAEKNELGQQSAK